MSRLSQRNANGKGIGLPGFGGNGHRPPALRVGFVDWSQQPPPTQPPFISLPNSPKLLLELQSLPSWIREEQIEVERVDNLLPPALGSLQRPVQSYCLPQLPLKSVNLSGCENVLPLPMRQGCCGLPPEVSPHSTL